MDKGFYNYKLRNPYQYKHGPVHTSQMEFELFVLVEIYKALKPMKVVEIGTEWGGTLYHWLINAMPGAKVVNIGKWDQTLISYDPVPGWQSWVPEGVMFTTILGDSHKEETKERLQKEMKEIDFLFIDGDHTYEGVKQDWLMYGPMVRSGGVIAFHDLLTPPQSPHIGVPILWREIQRIGYITRELFALPEDQQYWGGIGVVYV